MLIPGSGSDPLSLCARSGKAAARSSSDQRNEQLDVDDMSNKDTRIGQKKEEHNEAKGC